MTPAEAAALLAVAAAFDNRKPDADAATAWALALDGAQFNDCRDSIVAHYRRCRDWIMPSDVLSGVSAARIARLQRFENQYGRLMPPARFRDDIAGEHQWFREVSARIFSGEITTPEEIAGYEDEAAELVPHDVSSLGQIGREVPRP